MDSNIILLLSSALLGLACFIALGGLPGETILKLPEPAKLRSTTWNPALAPFRATRLAFRMLPPSATPAPASALAYAYAGRSSSTAQPPSERLRELESRWSWLRAQPAQPKTLALITARMEALHKAVEAAARIGGTIEHEDHGTHGEYTISKGGKGIAILVWGIANRKLTTQWVQA